MNEEGNFITIKESSHHEDTTVFNTHAPTMTEFQNTSSKKLTELKKQIQKPTITVGDFNTLSQ